MNTFRLDLFEEAFRDTVTLQESTLDEGGRKLQGASSLLKVELAVDRNDRLTHVIVVFPYFLKEPESNRKITAQIVRVLELCLPDHVPPQEWIELATQNLKASEEKEFESEYEGITIGLHQRKPHFIFVLEAERTGPRAQDRERG